LISYAGKTKTWGCLRYGVKTIVVPKKEEITE
jgi:hypothetical protein